MFVDFRKCNFQLHIIYPPRRPNGPNISHCFWRLSSRSSILSMLDVADIFACNWFCKLLCICVCRLVCIGVGRLVSIDACKLDCRAVCAFDCIAFSRLLCICAWRVFCKLLCMVEATWGMGWSNSGCMWLEFWAWLCAGRVGPEEFSSCDESGMQWNGNISVVLSTISLWNKRHSNFAEN